MFLDPYFGSYFDRAEIVLVETRIRCERLFGIYYQEIEVELPAEILCVREIQIRLGGIFQGREGIVVVRGFALLHQLEDGMGSNLSVAIRSQIIQWWRFV